jgi:predicted outer membrane repeat protein
VRHMVTGSVAIAVAFCSFAASATVIRVDCDGGGDYWTIQGAIDNASDGDTILVAPGVYVGGWNHNIDTQGLALLIVSEEGPEATIIDGENDYSGGFRFANGEGPDTAVDGFTVTRANGLSGIRCQAGSSPTVKNCFITACYSGTDGGGVRCKEGSSPTFQDCVFSDNTTAGQGGAVDCWNSCNPVFERCIFEGNAAPSWAGAVCLKYYSAALFVDCAFVGNTSYMSGGGVYCTRSSATFSGCVFSANEATHGGGLRATDDSDLVIESCRFSDNYGSDEGGGLHCDYNSDLTITGSTFAANETPIYGAALFVGSNATVGMQNSIIAFNIDGLTVWVDDDQMICECTDMYGNEGGNWGLGLSGQYPGNGNLRADPLFCMGSSTMPGDPYTLHSLSPCAPDNSSGCGLIGASPVGCGVTAVLRETWGTIKAKYR